MRWAWTGSRAPFAAGQFKRFTRIQELFIASDVLATVHDGDEIGCGGCNGVDEIVIQTGLLLRETLYPNLKVVVWPADGERTWELLRADILLIRRCDEVHWRENGWKFLELDRALVEWAEKVRAMPKPATRYGGSSVMS